MITTEKKNLDSAFYYEVCVLRILEQMGYLDHEALTSITLIAAEDYGSNIVIDKTLLCLN